MTEARSKRRILPLIFIVKSFKKPFLIRVKTNTCQKHTGSPSSLYELAKEHNMASNYKGLYGIFYKISVKVVKSENIQ